MTKSRKRKHRLIRDRLARRLDLGALLIGPLFVLIWGLVPSVQPPGGGASAPELRGLQVQAWGVPLRQVPVYVRPYLVTLPSRYSFVPRLDASEATAQVPAFSYDTSLGMLPSQPQRMVVDAGTSSDWQAGMRFPLVPLRNHQEKPVRRPVRRAESWRVWLSSGLAGSRFLLESPRLDALRTGVQAWEAEFWISFDERGMPQEVYVEKGSGIREIDRVLLRLLASPDVWEHARGVGMIEIRYDPVMGGEDADTNS